MTKASRARYTLEFKQEAVRLVDNGQSIAAAARTLGVVDQTLFNWVKAHRQGKLTGADSKAPINAEQMEISRLRAELARVKMERDILGKATAHTMQEDRFEVRLHPAPSVRVACLGAVRGTPGQRGGLPRAPRAPCQRCTAAPPERRGAAGAYQGPARRDAWRLRLASHLARAVGTRCPGGQAASAKAHATARHSRQRQAPFQGHH